MQTFHSFTTSINIFQISGVQSKIQFTCSKSFKTKDCKIKDPVGNKSSDFTGYPVHIPSPYFCDISNLLTPFVCIWLTSLSILCDIKHFCDENK